MIDAHPPIFSAVLLDHKTPEVLDLARRIVKDEHAHIDAMIDYIMRPSTPHSEQFGGMHSIDKHSDLL